MVINNVKNIRLQKGFTQEELAREVKCTLRTIQKIETSKNYNTSIEIALKIKEVLNIKNIEDLFKLI